LQVPNHEYPDVTKARARNFDARWCRNSNHDAMLVIVPRDEIISAIRFAGCGRQIR
jgi:hypothetical protein